MRRCLISAFFAVAMATPLSALAQDANCPPGSWFCEQVEPPDVDQAAPADQQLPPPTDAPEASPRPRAKRPHRRDHQAAPPPVVVYQPPQSGAAPQVVIVAPGGTPPPRVIVKTTPAAVPPPPAAPPPPKHRWRREWGINLRLEGMSFGRNRGASEDAGMGGLGLSLRYRPVPAFAFDIGADLIAGIDYKGYERTEVPLSLSGILFVNPRSKVQFYFLGGLHISHAETQPPEGIVVEQGDGPREYDYFGGHGGIGLEFRLSRRVALNIDALGFIRSRTDDNPTPEFEDPDMPGRTTNTSGGGLLRGGLSFYW